MGKAALRAGMNALVSEVHGMAQRGGSVVCTVRIGDVYSPLIADGSADAILSLEPIEALRNLGCLKKEGIIVTDISQIIPFTVSSGLERYPPLPEVYAEMKKKCGRLLKIDALTLATDAGAKIARNITMLGALCGSGVLPFSKECLLETIRETVPAKFVEANERAFESGYEAAKNE